MVLAVVFAVGVVAWVARELSTQDAVADLRVFRQAPFAGGTLVMALVGFVMYGGQTTLSLWLQTLLAYPSMQAGEAMLAVGLGAAFAMPIASVLVSRFDPRKVCAGGILGLALSFYQLMGFNLSVGYWDLFWPQFLQGASIGMVFVPLAVVTMAFIPKEKMGNATSLFNMMRNIGGGVGISLATTMLTRQGQAHTNLLVANITPVSPSATRLLAGMRNLFAGSGPGLGRPASLRRPFWSGAARSHYGGVGPSISVSGNPGSRHDSPDRLDQAATKGTGGNGRPVRSNRRAAGVEFWICGISWESTYGARGPTVLTSIGWNPKL